MSRAFLKQSDESSGKKDWILISNRDNEHLSQKSNDHLRNYEIVSQLSPPCTPPKTVYLDGEINHSLI